MRTFSATTIFVFEMLVLLWNVDCRIVVCYSKLVEDLARWKAGLCQKVAKYQKALKSLLEDNDLFRRDAFQTFMYA